MPVCAPSPAWLKRCGKTVSQAMALTCLALAAIATPALAEPNTMDALKALARAHSAVVGVQTVVADGARSAETLGRSRSGSGVVIGDDGLILTIGYLTLEAERIQITTRDGVKAAGRVVAYDVATGFSLIQPVLPLPGLEAVPLGDPRLLNPGDPVIAGYVDSDSADLGGAGLARLVRRKPFSASWEYHLESALFTTPPVPQHSGAPLFNQRGELLGIGSLRLQNTATESRPLPGNLFVPIDLLSPILQEMRASGSSRLSRRPWLGLNSSEQHGRIQLLSVSKGSPAQGAGLKEGDVILAVDDAKVTTLEGFYKTLWAHSEASRPVKLTVLQGADINTVLIDVVERLSTLRKPGGT